MRAALVLLLLVGIASAKPPPSGVYELERRGTAIVVDAITNKRIADCPTAESQPIPATLRIEHTGSSSVTVNTEQWDDVGLSTTADGKPDRFPFRGARKPNPAPSLETLVMFRTDGSVATGMMIVVALDKDRKPTCTVAYNFDGTYQP